MKKLLVSILTIFAINLSASAQEKPQLKEYKKEVYKSQHKHGMHGRKEMLKDLNLTDDQKKQLKANHDEFQKKMETLDKQDNMTVKEMREKKAALHKEQKAKNDAIFTPEQKEKMAQAKLKEEEAAKQHAEKRLEHMKTKLSLSDDQVAKLKAEDETARAKMKAIRENESLDPVAKKQQMFAVRKNSDEQRKTILTTDQVKKMDEMKKKKQ